MTTKPKLIEIPIEVPESWLMGFIDTLYRVYGKRLDPRDCLEWIDTLEKYPKPNVYVMTHHCFIDDDGQWKADPPSLKQVVDDLEKRGYAEFIWCVRQVAHEAQKRREHSVPATADEVWNVNTEAMLMAGLITLSQATEMMQKRSH
jgi:hypothetical protein